MKTVLITGCSSGYGLATARYFHAQGWNVIATMRNPREGLLPRSGRLHVVALDVTLELEFFNVRVKLVEPGYCPNTRFTSNGESRMDGLIPETYAPFAQPIFAAFARPAAITTEADVADAVWRAATDVSGQLRFPAGADAVALAAGQGASHHA